MTGRFAPDFMIMQRRKEEEYRNVYDAKVKGDNTIARLAHWEHKTSNRHASPRCQLHAHPAPRTSTKP